MKVASEAYLTELAEQFWSTQVALGWKKLSKGDLCGETVWIDATPEEPGVEVELNIRRSDRAIEVEVIAYQPGENDAILASVTRKGIVSP